MTRLPVLDGEPWLLGFTTFHGRLTAGQDRIREQRERTRSIAKGIVPKPVLEPCRCMVKNHKLTPSGRSHTTPAAVIRDRSRRVAQLVERYLDTAQMRLRPSFGLTIVS